MNLPWTPVVIFDICGSILVLLLAFGCVQCARQWLLNKQDDIFRQYIFLLALAIVFFAVSRSFGHLVKQLLLMSDQAAIWSQISPFSGAINSAAFVIIFAFGIYFHRFQKIHLEIERYKNNLEDMIAMRTEELEESKLALETILNNSNPICITSVDFELIQANAAYYAIWPQGGSNSQLQKCYESRPGAQCHTPQCPLQLIMEGREKVSHEVTKDVDGVKREFIITARPIRNVSDKLIGMVESFQEISDRKAAETALASERERLAVTLRSIGDAVITTDLNGQIVLINKVTERLTGWSQEEAVGRPVPEVFNIVNEKTGTPCSNPVEAAIRSGKIIELEKDSVLVARDGRRYSVEDSGAPIFDENSQIIGAVLVFRDVTGKKKTEEELQKVKKLESVGVLAGGIAHDFNNILAAIMGNLSLALRDQALSEKSQRLLSQAQKASCRARDLTQQLLTFAKGGEPIKEAASLTEVVKDSADFVLRGTRSLCCYDFQPDLWLVDIDKGQISQVVQNLILNASDAMPEGGTIEVRCRNVGSPSGGKGRFVELQVRDFGCGIEVECQEKIFDPYYSNKKKGTGLGLAITHSIITKHSGQIHVQSAPGEGATFTIVLPAATGDRHELPPQVEEALRGRMARILVMDDEELVRNVSSEMLEEMGHEVVVAQDGMEAIEIYRRAKDRQEPIDLAIMDLTIPGGMGGEEAVQEILKFDPEAKVVVSSGYSNDPIMANYGEYGFCAAISKPHQYGDLERLLAPLLVP